jgi:hypothetical protein
MNAGDPDSRDELTDEQLDGLLHRADQELLHHVQAGTDPTATLAKLLTIQFGVEHDREDPASELTQLTSGQGTGSPRRSWRSLAIPIAAAVATGIAALAGFVAAGHTAHRSTMPPPSTTPITAPTMHAFQADGVIGAADQAPVPAGVYFPPTGCTATAPDNRWQWRSATPIAEKLNRARLNPLDDHALKSILQTVRQYSDNHIVKVTITARNGDAIGKLARNRAQAICEWFIARHVLASDLSAAGQANRRAIPAKEDILNINIYTKG